MSKEKQCEHIIGITENVYKKIFFGLFKKRVPHFRCKQCNKLIPIKELLKDSHLGVIEFDD